jgi:hypothetical protein
LVAPARQRFSAFGGVLTAAFYLSTLPRAGKASYWAEQWINSHKEIIMAKIFQKMWADIKQRKNIELYLALIALIVIFVADVVGIDTNQVLFEIILAALAVVIYGMLGARHSSEKIEGEILSLARPSQNFMEKFPPDFDKDYDEAKELWIFSASYYASLKWKYSNIEEKLKKGHKVKILLANPNGVVPTVAAQRGYKPISTEQKVAEIRSTLNDLCELKKKFSHKLEIRTIDYPIPYKLYAMNPNAPTGIIYISSYLYKTKTVNMKFILRADNSDWYETYLSEIVTFWENGAEWDCSLGSVPI